MSPLTGRLVPMERPLLRACPGPIKALMAVSHGFQFDPNHTVSKETGLGNDPLKSSTFWGAGEVLSG